MKDDAGATVETPPGKGGEADAGAKAPEPKGSGNAWTDLGGEIEKLGHMKNLGELAGKDAEEGEQEKAEKKAPAKAPAKPAPKGEHRPGEKEEPEPPDEEEDTGKEKPEGEQEEDEEEQEPEGTKDEKAPGTRYSVVAGDGAEFEFEALPKGAKIVFKAAGRKVEAKSLDDLVTMAQQGATLRATEATYQRQLAGAGKTIKGLTARLTAADKAFQEIVSDEEKLEEYRARVKKLQDPEYREGLEAKRKLAQKEEQEADDGDVVLEQVTTEFWDEAKNQFETKLETYPTLEAEDYPDVVRAFWGNFTAHRDELVQDALTEAGTEELTKAQLEEIDADAIRWLTEDNFEAAMRSLHEKIERRTGRTGGGNGRRKAATQEEVEAAEADRHNKHVDDKLRQRDTRTLKGKGAPPGRGGEREERPTTWKGHMDSIHEEFEKAKKPAVAD